MSIRVELTFQSIMVNDQDWTYYLNKDTNLLSMWEEG